MSLRAHDVARELRDRLPGLPIKKLHKLLYYCQGHHLAATGEPLFVESLSAWDMGPVVGRLWRQEHEGLPPGEPMRLNEQQLNTVGYVVSRYGQLSGLDLQHLTHSETPWIRANEARSPGDSSRIEREWIEDYFRRSTVEDSEDSGLMDAAMVAQWLAPAEERRTDRLTGDTPQSLRARMTSAR